MSNIDDYIKKTYELEEIINNSEYYKNHYKRIKPLLNLGIHIPKGVPFFLSSLLVAGVLSLNNSGPFTLDDRIEKANSKTIYYGEDEILEAISFYKKFEDSLKYTTAWKDIGNGLHERIVTTYEVPSHDELTEEKVHSLSKDELDEYYSISNVETFIRSVIPEDEMRFDQDMVVVEVNNGKSSTDTRLKEQTYTENLFTDFFLFSVLSVLLGGTIDYLVLEKVKSKMKKHLESIDERLKLLDSNSLKKLEKDLELRKENLELLKSDEKTLCKRRTNR